MADIALAGQTRAIAATPHPPQVPKAGMTPERLRRAAGEFEAFYLAQALQPMFEGISSEAPFGGGMAEEMWRSLLVDEYGKAMAKAGGIGIADTIVRSLVDVQEQAAARDPAAPPHHPPHEQKFFFKETVRQ